MSDDADFRPQDFGIGRLFNYVRDAVIVADAASERIVLWNECASQVLGYSREEALELPLHALVPEDLRSAHRAGLARYQETGEGNLVSGDTRVVELAAIHKEGHLVPIELTLTAIPEVSDEGHRFALAIMRDVSDRRTAEEDRMRLREADLQRKQALQLNDDVVQGLVVASMALEVGDEAKSREALAQTLKRAQGIISDLIYSLRPGGEVLPGDFVRTEPAGRAEDEER